jgi:predicted enzyme related to lactoylglutathione lyase
MAAIRFGRAVLMVRGTDGIANAVKFYNQGLGLQVTRVTDEWAELRCASSFCLNLQAVSTEAHLSCGYSPMLSFEVSDMDGTVARCVHLGAHLDGPIQYPAHGKVAALRSPDGHMVGLYEPTF